MELITSARELADFIRSTDELEFVVKNNWEGYNHLGALLTDIVLQSGLNYQTVVQPRVNRVVSRFPETATLTGVISVLESEGAKELLDWNHQVKLDRFNNLIEFCKLQNLESCEDMRSFLYQRSNHDVFLAVNGIGPKTLDYTMKLLAFDTIAVDRHIIGFVEMAGLRHSNYQRTKMVVEYAADLIQVSRSSLDATIWKFMSAKTKAEENPNQLTLSFEIASA